MVGIPIGGVEGNGAAQIDYGSCCVAAAQGRNTPVVIGQGVARRQLDRPVQIVLGLRIVVQVRPRIAPTKIRLRIGGIVLDDLGHLCHDVLLLVRIAVQAAVKVAQVHRVVPRPIVQRCQEGFRGVPNLASRCLRRRTERRIVPYTECGIRQRKDSREARMLKVTNNLMMPTAITGSYPRPLWFTESLRGRSFKAALGDSLFREQYMDAIACIINAQEAAGLDIVTDGDSRFDLAVGGKSWFFYPIERLGGLAGHRDTSRGWMQRHDLRPGRILWEVQEAYQPAVVMERLSRGALEFPALWQVAQRLSDRPVKFGTICAPALASMLWNEHYRDEKDLINDLCDIFNAELRELVAAGCPLIQIEEPPHHGRTTRPDCTDADLEFLTEAFNRQLVGVDAEIWVHTCWGNPNQQRVYWEPPSYERALPYLLQLQADVITFECASSNGRDLPLFAKHQTDKKIAIGVVNHCDTVVEPAEHVAALIRKALEFIPKEQLIISTDCGFGREGLSRRIAFYKCVALVEGTNIVRRELGLPEARVRAADPKLWFAGRELKS